MKCSGRPDDKSSYVNFFLSSLKFSHAGDTALEKALGKLNAKEIVLLSTYLSKQNKQTLEELITPLPSETPAQKGRIVNAIELYKELRNKNELRQQKAEVTS
jgi:hypothetical protein